MATKEKSTTKESPTKKTAAKSKPAVLAAEAATETEEVHHNKDLSLQELEDNCNSDELNIPGKLQSLQAAKNTDGTHVTVAIYKVIPRPVGVGNLKLRVGGTDTAWIKDINTKVSF